MSYLYIAALLLTMALVSAPAASARQSAAVTGTVIYLERIMLPPTAQVNVQLQDVSRADAPATVLAEQTIDTAGKGPPYAFSLAYDPAAIVDSGRYVVRAQINNEGQLIYTSTESYPVITQSNPTSDVEIIVRRVATPSDPAATSGPSGDTSGPATLPATGDAGGGPTLLMLLTVGLLLSGGLLLRRSSR